MLPTVSEDLLELVDELRVLDFLFFFFDALPRNPPLEVPPNPSSIFGSSSLLTLFVKTSHNVTPLSHEENSIDSAVFIDSCSFLIREDK